MTAKTPAEIKALMERVDALLAEDDDEGSTIMQDTSDYGRMVADIRERLGVDEYPDEARDTFADIANHGADTGWSGFTYTSDCVAFFDAHEDTIMDMLRDEADNFGYSNVAEFVGTFNRADMTDSIDGYKNLLAWYVLETVARNVTDEADE